MATGFVQGGQVTKTSRRPQLAASLEAALFLPAGRFDRARSNRPAPSRRRLVIHPPLLPLKTALLLPEDFSPLAPARFPARDLPEHSALLAVPELMEAWLDPRGDWALASERLA